MIRGVEPRISEGGKIKIGGLGEERTSNGKKWRLPVKYDYFTITTTQRENPADDKSDLITDEAVMKLLEENGCADGDGKIREIPVVVHSDEIDEVFPTCYACYNGKKCICTGDGEVATRTEYKDNKKTGNVKQVTCPCDWLKPGSRPQCKPHGTFHCSIALPGAAVAGAVYKWRTTSLMSVQRMLGSLIHIKATTGLLQGLPLTLRLSAVHVEPEGAQASTVYVCHLELRAKSLEAVQQRALELAQLRNAVCGKMVEARRQYRALIEAPAVDESDAEQAAINDEFYPETPGDDGADSPTELEKIIASSKAAQPAPGDKTGVAVIEEQQPSVQATTKGKKSESTYDKILEMAAVVGTDGMREACNALGIDFATVKKNSPRLDEILAELEKAAAKK